MLDKNSDQSTTHTQALAWARKSFPFSSHTLVTNHPWATMLRLSGDDGHAYLKILPTLLTNPKPGLNKISEYFGLATPTLINFDTNAGFFLYQDHGSSALARRPGPETVQEILTTYARLQATAARLPDLIQALPSLEIEAQFDRLLVFLDGSKEDAGNGNAPVTAVHFLPAQTVARYRRIFLSVSDMFKHFLVLQNEAPVTINHCDLRAKNVAQKPDGSLVIFDWDDAVSGPPGVSLHALFGGSTRPYVALWSGPETLQGVGQQDRQLLDAYLDVLCDNDVFTREKVAADLPAVICAGVIQYILNFGDYAIQSRSQRDVIGKNIRRRLSDLMNLAHLLVLSSPKSTHQYARALNENGRAKRAQLLLDLALKPTDETKDISNALAQSDNPGVIPTIKLSAAERRLGVLHHRSRDLGVALFKRHGTLLIENAIPEDLVTSCHREFLAQYDTYLQDTRHKDALRVGDKRFMITVKFDGPFAQPDFFASPFVMPILNDLLGQDAILGSLTTVASLPGSENQRMHKDNAALFKDEPDLQVPSFSIAMIVPMISLNAVNGATRVVKGSHLKTSAQSKEMPFQDPVVKIGSCFLMDCRLSHRGMANKSKDVRPITSLVYQRPWYRDHLNFQKQTALDIDAAGLRAMPENLQNLVSWAVDT